MPSWMKHKLELILPGEISTVCVMHTVKGFSVANEAGIFWNFLAFSMIQQMLYC